MRSRVLVFAAVVAISIASLGISGAVADEGAERPKTSSEPLYAQLSRAVIRLERPVVRAGSEAVPGMPRYEPHGTAFFVELPSSPGSDRYVIYLVTARHVADVAVELRARVSTQRLDNESTDVIELRVPREAWIMHPEGARIYRGAPGLPGLQVGPVDVAVARVPELTDRRLRSVGYCPNPCATPDDHQFLDQDPEPPTAILVFGFPENLGFQLLEQRPFARLGLVAMVETHPYIQINGVYRDERVILVDAPVFPGNSGSPVFTKPEGGQPLRLAGLVSASNTSLSFAVIEPVSRVREALEVARIQKPRSTAEWHLPPN